MERLTRKDFKTGDIICTYSSPLDCNDSCIYGEPKCKWNEKVYNRLAEFEDFMEEQGFESLEELKNRLYFDKNLILDLEAIRADKNNPLKPRFYYDENVTSDCYPYAFCARPYDDNMSLHCFMKNGVPYGYASEHYDTWCKNTKPIKEMNFNEWAIKFIMPLIQENQAHKNRWQKLKEWVVKEQGYASMHQEEKFQTLDEMKDKMQELERGGS